MFTGIIILILGLVFLLQNLGVISYSFFALFWPIVLIAIGVNMIMKRMHRTHCETCSKMPHGNMCGWNMCGCPMCKKSEKHHHEKKEEDKDQN